MTAGFRLDPKQTQLGNGPFVKTGFGQNLPTQAQHRHNLNTLCVFLPAPWMSTVSLSSRPGGPCVTKTKQPDKTRQDNLTRQDKTRQILDR
jgi:hypothetical protein